MKRPIPLSMSSIIRSSPKILKYTLNAKKPNEHFIIGFFITWISKLRNSKIDAWEMSKNPLESKNKTLLKTSNALIAHRYKHKIIVCLITYTKNQNTVDLRVCIIIYE